MRTTDTPARPVRGREAMSASAIVSRPAMITPQPSARKELATFLGLTFGVSAGLYWLILSSGGLAQGQRYIPALMWTPGVSALATRMVLHHNVRDLGWRWPATRWVALSYFVPLVYATAAYAVVWLTGLGDLSLARFRDNALLFVVVGSLLSVFMSAGEEIGWRGFLVPVLARTMLLGRTACVSGGIWVAWHAPLILFGDYSNGLPKWYALGCFTIMTLSVALPLAWLRLRTDSVWPAAFLHASHNLYVQGFFDRVTVDTGVTRWLTGEFAAALAVTTGATAWLFWRAPRPSCGPELQDGR